MGSFVFSPVSISFSYHCQLTFFDIRGCGRSAKHGSVEDDNLDIAVDDLRKLMGCLNVKERILLGFSWGGRLALRFLDKHPEFIRGIILASSTAYTDFNDDLTAWSEYAERRSPKMQDELKAVMESKDFPPETKTRQMTSITLPLDIYDLTRIPEAERVISRIAFSGEWMQAWQAGTLNANQHADYQLRLVEVGKPLMILHGEKDMRFPASTAIRLREAVPFAELNIIKGAGHLTHIEATDRWLEAVKKFIQQSEV